ncbi:hypothetical protein QE382_001725 [Sphingobacterium zeae]|uniref:Uncharacterized protein n=1 Tax=Sphingobacterium zeae TaxID=1776859 RepID=A0ABU0U646_9SPHI|nr:hypothetical protein [Sphingobacterium zeae]
MALGITVMIGSIESKRWLPAHGSHLYCYLMRAPVEHFYFDFFNVIILVDTGIV